MTEIKGKVLEGERALYNTKDTRIIECVFQNGESPLKESDDIEVIDTVFRWKYPLWYCNNVLVNNSVLLDTARSGIWYTNNITINNTAIHAPKLFRRCKKVNINNCNMPNALEMFWGSDDITITNTSAKGDYFGFNSKNIKIENFDLQGNYCFDGGENIEINNSRFDSKDSFWNCKNVYVKNSYIVGEYLGWNSENLVFENCTIESNQGFCYIKGIKLINCKLINTDLCFELCENIDADIKSSIVSVKNPISGVIKAESIGEIILDEKLIDPKNTKIITK